MFNNILVPIDGSDHSRKAVAVAGDLAARNNARIVLLHVITEDQAPEELARFAEIENIRTIQGRPDTDHLEPMPHAPVLVPGGTEKKIDHQAVLQDIAGRILGDAEDIARRHGVTRVETLTQQGDPAERILNVAERLGVEGIVIGSRGLGGLKSALFGSVSHQVCEAARCTCITVN